MTIVKKISLSVALIGIVLVLIGILLAVIVQRVTSLSKACNELPELQAKLGTLTIQHYEWVSDLGVNTLLLKKEFKRTLDPHECDLGKWYESFSPPPELKETYENIRKPHEAIHLAGGKIMDALKQNNFTQAIKIYEEEVLTNLATTKNNLTEMRLGIKNIVDSNLKEISSSVTTMRNIIFIIFGMMVVVVAIFSYLLLIRPLSRDFKQLMAMADGIARGDFSSVRD